MSSHSAALVKKASTRASAECTGLRLRMTPSAAAMSTAEKR